MPNTGDDEKKMLAAVGCASAAELFEAIPEKFRFPDLKLPPPLSEPELVLELQRLAEKNFSSSSRLFAGGGAYNHFVPSVVDALSSRGEFLTSYTPYQPEASQGTLQALFEYQSMVADLFGMEVVNASHYDGATALAEAVLMAYRAQREERKKVLLSAGVHPEYRDVIKTYTEVLGISLLGWEEGLASPEALAARLDEETACVVVSFPSFFGDLADYRDLAKKAHEKGVLFVATVDPLVLGLFEPPGKWGADIVTGEGQSLGNHLSFGGPCLGLFAATKDLVRRMPGRLAGMTQDADGKCGFVLTLSTREQHIRRERATSNICSNQGLAALRAAIYLAVLGKAGVSRVAELCYRRAHYAEERLRSLPGFDVEKRGPFFKEFVLRCPKDAAGLVRSLASQGIVPGVPLSRYFPERKNELLVCVTEMNDKKSIDALAEALKTAAS